MVTRELNKDLTTVTRSMEFHCFYDPVHFNSKQELIEHYQDCHLMTKKQALLFHRKYNFIIKGWDVKQIDK